MPPLNTSSSLSQRTNAYADAKLLERMQYPLLVAKYGQARPLPQNKGQNIWFRRYERLDNTPVILSEGQTPNGKPLTYTDVKASIFEYGDFVPITDVIQDTHEDPILNESVKILGEQSGQMLERVNLGTLLAGTNILYANGVARSDVNVGVSTDLFRTAVRILQKAQALKITELTKAGLEINTYPIPASYVAFAHTDLNPDLDRCEGRVKINQYSTQMGLLENEWGSIGDVRIVNHNLMSIYTDEGGDAGEMLSTTGSKADVYPILIIARNSFGVTTLSGKGDAQVLVNNPRPQGTDPLAQRGTVGWKAYSAGAPILNQTWLLRMEVAAQG